MTSFDDILDLWPTLADLARDIGVPPYLPRMWRHRGVIPHRHWSALIKSAQSRGFDAVTLDVLDAAYAAAIPDPLLAETEPCE